MRTAQFREEYDKEGTIFNRQSRAIQLNTNTIEKQIYTSFNTIKA